MFDKLIRGVKSMELEDQILHAGALVTALGVFFPWFGDQRFGASQVFSGFSYYTGYIGWSVFLIQLFLLLITISPMLGGPVMVRKSSRPAVRMVLCSVTTLLLFAAFSVLLSVTFEISSADVRMGIYFSLIGSFVSLLYAYMRYRQHERSKVQELFHHPDESAAKLRTPAAPEPDLNTPPPPPPPPPLPAEDHNLFK
jgi:phosphoglycerol transferase MdoB-like AlkP superfamily enzyme